MFVYLCLYQVADDTIQVNNLPYRDSISNFLQTATLELVAVLL